MVSRLVKKVMHCALFLVEWMYEANLAYITMLKPFVENLVRSVQSIMLLV